MEYSFLSSTSAAWNGSTDDSIYSKHNDSFPLHLIPTVVTAIIYAFDDCGAILPVNPINYVHCSNKAQ